MPYPPGCGSRGQRFRRALKVRLFNGREFVLCCFCRTKLVFSTATLEHKIPRARGGRWVDSNMALSCRQCNNRRGTQDFETFQHKVAAERGLSCK